IAAISAFLRASASAGHTESPSYGLHGSKSSQVFEWNGLSSTVVATVYPSPSPRVSRSHDSQALYLVQTFGSSPQEASRHHSWYWYFHGPLHSCGLLLGCDNADASHAGWIQSLVPAWTSSPVSTSSELEQACVTNTTSTAQTRDTQFFMARLPHQWFRHAPGAQVNRRSRYVRS